MQPHDKNSSSFRSITEENDKKFCRIAIPRQEIIQLQKIHNKNVEKYIILIRTDDARTNCGLNFPPKVACNAVA